MWGERLGIIMYYFKQNPQSLLCHKELCTSLSCNLCTTCPTPPPEYLHRWPPVLAYLAHQLKTCSPHMPSLWAPPARPLTLSTLRLAALRHSAHPHLTLPSFPQQHISTSDGHPSQLTSSSSPHTSHTFQLRPMCLWCTVCGYLLSFCSLSWQPAHL